jgi:hypothetical protein
MKKVKFSAAEKSNLIALIQSNDNVNLSIAIEIFKENSECLSASNVKKINVAICKKIADKQNRTNELKAMIDDNIELLRECAIEWVYQLLQNREIHPAGEFDKRKRFYAKNENLIDVRQPTAAFPNSQMIACRTKKYVKAVAQEFGFNSIQYLIINC